jgi:hypothetical protein
MATGMRDSLERWSKRGQPLPDKSNHIELARKQVAKHPINNEEIKVNLNENLYPKNENRIFSEGANFDEANYIHLKVRDLRIELSLDEFNKLSEAIIEAKDKLCLQEQ